MAELPVLPLKTDALLADTSHMSASEFGAYVRILLVMWRHGARLPDDEEELARIAGVPPSRWRQMAEKVRRPLTSAGGILSQKRLTDTWLRVQEKRRRNAEAGASGAAHKWGGDQSSAGATRSARLAAAREKGRHTKDQWLLLLAACGRRCVKCGASGEIVKDHIVPIYQGGSDGIENLQPLCLQCNSSKGPDRADYRPPTWRDSLAGKTPGKTPGETPGETAGETAGERLGSQNQIEIKPESFSDSEPSAPKRANALARAPAQETLKNQTNNPAGELATALGGGALTRPPESENASSSDAGNASSRNQKPPHLATRAEIEAAYAAKRKPMKG